MIVLGTRALEGLKSSLGRRRNEFGDASPREASSQVAVVELAQLSGDLAGLASRGPTSADDKLLARAILLEIAAVSLRAVEAIDEYDLKLHWRQQQTDARAA